MRSQSRARARLRESRSRKRTLNVNSIELCTAGICVGGLRGADLNVNLAQGVVRFSACGPLLSAPRVVGKAEVFFFLNCANNVGADKKAAKPQCVCDLQNGSDGCALSAPIDLKC